MGIIVSSDTIAAVATPPGLGAIGVVRISGEKAADILSKVFAPSRPKTKWESHKMYYGHIKHAAWDISLIDEVMCVYMKAPKTYTREDIAEIYTHGGQGIWDVLSAVVDAGARLAEPGEFTLRAFLNGRLDLSQAEAVTATINAKTDIARQAGLRQLGGGMSRQIEKYRNDILTLIANIELSIDYPEHESEAKNLAQIGDECEKIEAQISKLLSTYDIGRIITEGVRSSIIGRPNVGKSSLLNAILREDRAIVTHIPGTTRDILVESVNIRGIPLILADTAGIRETGHIIEKIGVSKSLEHIESAELVLWVCDRSLDPCNDDMEIAAKLRDKNAIVLLNKCDLPEGHGWRDEDMHPFPHIVEVSALTGEGLDTLYDIIEEMFYKGMATDMGRSDILICKRHNNLLGEAKNQLNEAIAAIGEGYGEDLVSVHLTAVYRLLGEILGVEINEDIIDKIFSEFCLGK